MADNHTRKKLTTVYRALYKTYGAQHWWPGETRFEVIVGAMLTQNTAWSNVEKAIRNLKRERILTPAGIARVSLERLASLIRPSGYFNIKAKRLKNLIAFLDSCYEGSLNRMFSADPVKLRRQLLDVNGIGPETADSILLYAGELPFFVIDAYTRRILSRHGLMSEDADYETVQRLFMENLPRRTRIYNEYHALLVKTGEGMLQEIETDLHGMSPLASWIRLSSPPPAFLVKFTF